MLITHGFSKTYGLYSSHGALQEPNLLGVVAFVCTPLPTRTQRLPTLLRQQCWELLRPFARSVKPRANGRNIVGCYMLHPFVHPVASCWMLLRVVAQSLKPVKLLSQQLPTFPLFCDRRSVAQQCWIRLHSSSNIVGATLAHYAWFTKTYGLYPSHDALQVPTLSGVVASVCTSLPTRTQQCWELLRPFARSLSRYNTGIPRM